MKQVAKVTQGQVVEPRHTVRCVGEERRTCLQYCPEQVSTRANEPVSQAGAAG